MKNFSNLSKRDLHYYYQFLNQMKIGFQNELLDKSLKLINNFILSKYQSNDFQNLTLEDFIQECYTLVISNNKTMGYNMINRLYDKLKNNDNNQSKKEYIDNNSYEINYDSIYFDMILDKMISSLHGIHDKEVLKYIIINNDLHVDNKVFNLTKTRISQIKEVMFRRLRFNKDLREYYSDYIFDVENYYNNKLKNMSIKDYICQDKSVVSYVIFPYSKSVQELFIKFDENYNNLTKKDLFDILNHLYILKRTDYYKYHEEDIENNINKIRKRLHF